MTGFLNVHVRINDAGTGQPTPVRLSITDATGRYYPPLGYVHDFPVGRNEAVGGQVYVQGQRYAYVTGSCEIPLPAGVPLTVRVSKGPRYQPLQETVVLGTGQLSLRLAIQPAFPPTMFAVDGRCHFLTPHAAQLQAAAEGLDLINLLACVQEYPSTDGHMYRLTPNLEAFSGQAEAVPGVYVNTFNTHPVLGRLALLNCHRTVYPLTFGGDTGDDWSLADWCQQCHRKKGLAVWCDAYRSEYGLSGGEGLIDVVLGKLDAIEVDAAERKTPFLPLWYRLLNAGFSLPLVGSSAKASNRDLLGSMRTLTPPSEQPTYAEWIEHVRSGRTVVSNGPFLRFAIDGTVWSHALNMEPRTVPLRAEVTSVVPFERLEIVANGEVIGHATPNADSPTSAVLELEQRIEQSSWLAARCWGQPSTLYPNNPVFAHTSAIWVNVAERPLVRSASALAAIQRDIETVRAWIVNEGRFVNPRRQEQLIKLADDALAKLR